MIGQNQMLLQKQSQDQTEIAGHMETLAQRDTEIRNLRLDVQKVRVSSTTEDQSDEFPHQLSDDANTIRQEKASVQALLDSATAQRKILEVR